MLKVNEIETFKLIAPQRNKRLFIEFLPKGYHLTTLDSVKDIDHVVNLKILLGSIITLYDDFADNPKKLNSKLLARMYKIPFENIDHDEIKELSKNELMSFNLARDLFERLFIGLSKLKNYKSLLDLFLFDLKQFFLANEYCEHLTKNNNLSNNYEKKLYLHHNMGIVMAGMIDLMSLESLPMKDLGKSREIFLLAQRAGRISNMLVTSNREKEEGDITAESQSVESLVSELESLITVISQKEVACFNCFKYARGIKNLHNLHQSLKGVI